jgi:subtilisin family serine protease
MWIRTLAARAHFVTVLAVVGWALMDTPTEGAPLGAAARAALAKGQPVSALVEYDSSATDRSIAAARAARGLIRDDAALLLQRSQAYVALKGGVDPAIVRHGGVKLRDYRYMPLALWRISSPAALASIEQLPSVRMVHENINLLPVSVSDLGFINQPQTAAEGATGSGTTIAVIDGGLGSNYLNYSDFGSCIAGALPQANCRVVYDQDFYNGSNGPVSQETVHGTNVSAIALGVAAGADLVMFDVFSGTDASGSDVLTAIDTSISLQATYNIVAINMSLSDGTSNTSPCTTSVFRTAVANATAAGITVVAAAGNSGSKTGLGNPACTPETVSVGAVYDSSYGTVEWEAPADSGGACTDASAPDLVTCFSQSAGYLTVLAPGTFVSAPSAAFQDSGTSQATPHISGAVAVLRALYPAEPLSETVQRLQITGPADTDPANGMSWLRSTRGAIPPTWRDILWVFNRRRLTRRLPCRDMDG